MELSAAAIVCASRPQGETGCVARLLTAELGLVAAFVAGGRGRRLRPVLIAGNAVAAELRATSAGRMLYARLELTASRAPFLAEPLPAAAIGWATALTAAALPERHPYPPLYAALAALLDAIGHAPSARGWVPGLVAYERLLLRELGYGDHRDAGFAQAGVLLARYPLADRRGDVMAARARLGELLARME